MAIKEKTQDDISSFMNKHWQKFFAKFEEIETLAVSEWKEVHILAYICKRYEQVFGKKFSVSVKGAPGKCTEIYQTKQIIATLQTRDGITLKQYVDWVFDTKIIPKHVKLQKIGFFITPGFANEFYQHKKSTDIIKRSTPLPDYYIAIANNLNIEAKTYGDLAFIKMANAKTNLYNGFFEKLSDIGFEPSMLDNLAQ